MSKPKAVNGSSAPGAVHSTEIDLDGELMDAINAALVATFAGVEPVLNAKGEWTWTFPTDEGQPEQVFTGKPPAWAPYDLGRLLFILDALCMKDEFAFTILGRPTNGPDGLKDVRAQVQIGQLNDNAFKARSRAEASPPGLAIAMALLGHVRVDPNAWRERLFPKVALADAQGNLRN